IFQGPMPELAASGERVAIAFTDGNLVERLGWREIVVSAATGAEVATERPYIDRSGELRAYPPSSLAEAPDEPAVNVVWTAGTGDRAPVAAVGAAPAAERGGGDGFTALVLREGSVWTLAICLIVAMGFGMVHALGPGHGKTVVAAYLVGSRGNA